MYENLVNNTLLNLTLVNGNKTCWNTEEHRVLILKDFIP